MPSTVNNISNDLLNELLRRKYSNFDSKYNGNAAELLKAEAPDLYSRYKGQLGEAAGNMRNELNTKYKGDVGGMLRDKAPEMRNAIADGISGARAAFRDKYNGDVDAMLSDLAPDTYSKYKNQMQQKLVPGSQLESGSAWTPAASPVRAQLGSVTNPAAYSRGYVSGVNALAGGGKTPASIWRNPIQALAEGLVGYDHGRVAMTAADAAAPIRRDVPLQQQAGYTQALGRWADKHNRDTYRRTAAGMSMAGNALNGTGVNALIGPAVSGFTQGRAHDLTGLLTGKSVDQHARDYYTNTDSNVAKHLFTAANNAAYYVPMALSTGAMAKAMSTPLVASALNKAKAMKVPAKVAAIGGPAAGKAIKSIYNSYSAPNGNPRVLGGGAYK